MYTPFSILVLFSFLFIACNDDETPMPPEEMETEIEANFYALTIGNSWTYSLEVYDMSSETYQAKDFSLTNTITASEVIDGETYFTISTTTQGEDSCASCISDIGDMQVRDSIGYLVKRDGRILFSKESADEYVISDDDWGTVYGALQPDDVTIVSSAGSFEALQNDRYAILANGETSPGRDARYQYNSIGLVQRSISTVNNPVPKWILTLDSYTLQ